jgi:hypothetical protein
VPTSWVYAAQGKNFLCTVMRLPRDGTLARLTRISRHSVSLARPRSSYVPYERYGKANLEGYPVEKNNQLLEPECEQRLETLFADLLRRHMRTISGGGESSPSPAGHACRIKKGSERFSPTIGTRQWADAPR